MSDAKFQVRMPTDLHREIADAAKANRRSMNAEIIARLSASQEPQAAPDELRARVMALERQVATLLKKAKS